MPYLKRNPVTVARQVDYIFKQVLGKVILSSIHLIQQILINDCREYQGRVTKHFHVPLYVEGAPKLDDYEGNKVTEFTDQYITCSCPMKNKYSDLNDLVKTPQSHHHTQTCTKRKAVICRFNATWPIRNETLTICKAENKDKCKIRRSKTVVDKVFLRLSR